ncbi:MAG: SpoIIE family protein phosphatase [Cyanobacteria bacterium REEB65]|nr:SpoIIE family protein phosphatase [Cyanobacteria bacterium REEB65]
MRSIGLAIAFSLPAAWYLKAPPTWQTLATLAYFGLLLSGLWSAATLRWRTLARQMEAEMQAVRQGSRFEIQRAYRAGQQDLVTTIQADSKPLAPPALPGLQVAVHQYKSPGCGGDMYDFCPLPSGLEDGGLQELGLYVVDMRAKSVRLAVVQALARAALRSKLRTGLPPHTALSALHADLAEELASASACVSAFLATFRAADRNLCYAGAGFPPPLMRRADGSILQLKTEDALLGAATRTAYQERRVALDPGDTLVLYSDGVVEARSPSRDRFGFERLVELIRSHCEPSPGELLATITDRLAKWQQGIEDKTEDQTILVLQATRP